MRDIHLELESVIEKESELRAKRISVDISGDSFLFLPRNIEVLHLSLSKFCFFFRKGTHKNLVVVLQLSF